MSAAPFVVGVCHLCEEGPRPLNDDYTCVECEVWLELHTPLVAPVSPPTPPTRERVVHQCSLCGGDYDHLGSDLCRKCLQETNDQHEKERQRDRW